jgi:hypothetical protein
MATRTPPHPDVRRNACHAGTEEERKIEPVLASQRNECTSGNKPQCPHESEVPPLALAKLCADLVREVGTLIWDSHERTVVGRLTDRHGSRGEPDLSLPAGLSRMSRRCG